MKISRHLIKLIVPPSVKVLDFFLSCFGQIFRAVSLVRKRWPGDDPASGSKLAAVFVHYDRKGVIHDYVLHQLRELSSAGFRIVFVSNAPTLPEGSIRLIAPFCQTILWRYNLGYDFGGYKDGLKAIDALDQHNAVLLMNDSIYGPFFALRDILGSIDRSSVDFWGITDSWQHRFHIQSYFIIFLPNVLKSPVFRNFWRTLPYVSQKGWVIRNAEMKLSQVLTSQKLRAGVMIPYWSVARTVSERLVDIEAKDTPDRYKAYLRSTMNTLIDGRPLNSTHHFWDVLIADYKCPFVKRELLKYNPAGIPLVSRWPDVITKTSDYDISMIWRHLQI